MNISGLVDNIEFQEPAGYIGATSLSYVVRVEGKQYFMKQLRPEYASELRYRAAFYKEYETGRRISNRHILHYESIGENADGLYLLMEHVNGQTLDEKIKHEPEWFANEKHVERLLRQLLDGLEALHSNNVAYLDLKPDNVMLTQVSNEVKIIDLGFSFTDGYSHTAGRTLGFAAPELAEGRMGEVDARTDIYAVGRLMLYIKEQAKVKYSRRLERIMQQCLREQKQERFESAKEMSRALNRKSRTIKTLVAVGCIATIIAAVWGWKQFEGTESHRQLMMYIEKDAEVGGLYYVITSEDSATCMAIGRQRKLAKDKETGDVIIYLSKEVEIRGKLYKVTKIAEAAFSGYPDIASVSFPPTLREIGDWAFHGDTSLVYATIPEGVVALSNHCFRGTGLRSVKLPRSLRRIGNATFVDNRHLKEVIIPEGVESLEVDAFGNCKALESITLPSTLKTISRGVFWECCKLKEITLPAGLTTIGEYAFFHCDSLKHIYNHSPEPQDIPRIVNRKDITLHVPVASVEKYRNAQHWRDMTLIGDL